MTNAQPSGVVVDTMVISWLFDDRPHPLADRYRGLIGQTRVLLAFQTVMELGYGALRAALGDKPHDGDRWIAAAAMRIGVPLASHDGLFDRAPGLVLITAIDGE